MSDSPLYSLATMIVPMVFAIVLHEIAHGYVARMLGDPTAAERGRLSLNPLRHVDWFGTIVLPAALSLAGLPRFGWAKPVPVDYARLRHPKRDMAIVGAAGPLTNFALAVLSAVVIGLIVRALGPNGQPSAALGFALDNLQNFIVFNLFLGLFNLLPLPPFDGSRVLRGVAPWPLVRVLDRIEPVGLIVFIALFVLLPQVLPSFAITGYVMVPVEWLFNQLTLLAAAVAGQSLAA